MDIHFIPKVGLHACIRPVSVISLLLLSVCFANNAEAQSLKSKLAKLSETADPASDEGDAPKDPIATEFYADIDHTTCFRESEMRKFGSIYQFRSSGATSEFVGYDQIQAGPDAEAASKLSKLKEEFPNLKYRRSSLYTLMVHNSSNPHWNVVAHTFGNFQTPEKFNDHNIGPYLIESNLRKDSLSAYLDQHLVEQDVAKKLVARWFNRSPSGGFNMDLISERGFYDASDLDVKIAKGSQRGLAVLADAGEELIGNTFVIISDYQFLSKEELANQINETSELVGRTGLANEKSAKVMGGINAVASVAGKGYVIKTTTYLYQLNWNDSISAVFYEQYWTEDGSIDPSRKAAFENSGIFSLKKVGYEVAWADVQATVFTQKSNADLIGIATIKATDKTIAKLQRKYESFRTKTPLYTSEPLTAKIGLKEDLTKGDKFEVLEQVLDADGRTRYKRVGVVTVDDTKIWDNRYLADEELKLTGGAEQVIEATHFLGQEKGLYAGMLIRQIN